jgi:predicted lipoprotein with Yx(FWY)xxD motif
VVALAGLLLAGCGVRFGSAEPGATGAAPDTTAHPGGRATITTSRFTDLGTVLVDGDGRTLYASSADERDEVSCDPHTPCLISWPPITVAPGVSPRARGGARQSLLGTIPGVEPGKRIVTYDGKPLYHRVSDVFPGETTGQALFDQGSHWYALEPTGRLVHRPPGHWNGGRTLETS